MDHGAAPQRKPREERHRTVLPARLRVGASWSDACILNISSRGLMVYAKCDARPGSYIELRRGGQLVLARVIWRRNHRIGLHSRDDLPVTEIISSKTAAAAAPAISGAVPLERRHKPRDLERSRETSRAVQFLSLVLVGTALAGAAGAYVVQTLGRPAAVLEAALRSR